MTNPIVHRRLAVVGAVLALTAGLGACSGGIERGDYTAPIAVTDAPAPAPVVPVMAPMTAARPGRLPLLPPVPGEQGGLPPVSVAQLAPPPVVH